MNMKIFGVIFLVFIVMLSNAEAVKCENFNKSAKLKAATVKKDDNPLMIESVLKAVEQDLIQRILCPSSCNVTYFTLNGKIGVVG